MNIYETDLRKINGTNNLEKKMKNEMYLLLIMIFAARKYEKK